MDQYTQHFRVHDNVDMSVLVRDDDNVIKRGKTYRHGAGDLVGLPNRVLWHQAHAFHELYELANLHSYHDGLTDAIADNHSPNIHERCDQSCESEDLGTRTDRHEPPNTEWMNDALDTEGLRNEAPCSTH